MDNNDKIAIENLIIIARYMQDNSILSDEDEKLLERSIQRASSLIELDPPTTPSLPIELGEITELDVSSLVRAVKNRKKS